MTVDAALAVLVECDALVCAIPAIAVARLLLEEDATVTAPSAHAEQPSRVRVGAEEWLGFDLGALLGTGETRGAWVLLSISAAGQPVPIALRTGRCLAVRAVHDGVELPRRLFRARPRALRAAFSTNGLGVSTAAVCGARLDPAALLEGEPMRNALAALDARGRPR